MILFALLLVFIFILITLLCKPRPVEQCTFISPSCQPCFLVHSFDGYKRYWEPWIHFFFKFHREPVWPVYFASETILVVDQRVSPILTGKGEWGARLIQALEKIPEDYIFYFQEDIWLTDTLTQDYLDAAVQTIHENNLNYLKLQADCRFTVGLLDRIQDRRWYIISHHPGLWRKSYLLSTLQAHMTPFQHEITLNTYLHQHHTEADQCKCNLDFDTRVFPYIDASKRGKLCQEGLRMIQADGLQLLIESGAVLERKDC